MLGEVKAKLPVVIETKKLFLDEKNGLKHCTLLYNIEPPLYTLLYRTLPNTDDNRCNWRLYKAQLRSRLSHRTELEPVSSAFQA